MTRIKKIQEALKKHELDAIVLFSESNVRYAGQFAFTDGAVAVTRERAVLVTDSRYVEAAEAEAKDVEVRCVSAEVTLSDILKETLSGCARIGAEAERLPHAQWEQLGQKLGHDLLPADAVLRDLRAAYTRCSFTPRSFWAKTYSP